MKNGVCRESEGEMVDEVVITGFGAVGDGVTAAGPAIREAIRTCAAAGGGTVVAPAGTYLTGPFELLSNVTLHLEPGAVLRASSNLEEYPVEAQPGSVESDRAGLITARGATNVAITGRGTIDGSGISFVDPSVVKPGRDFDSQFTRQGDRFMSAEFGTAESSLAHGPRPGNLIRFFDCDRVLLDGVTISNSPTWTVHLGRCRSVDISGVRIHSRGSGRRVPNDDGIDLRGCQGVRIRGCEIETGDDCIAVFGGENIVVTGCTLSARSAGIRVGYVNSHVRNCVFSDLVIHDSHRGIGIFARGDCLLENLLFSNIVIETRHVTGHWWGAAEPIHVSAMPLRAGENPGAIRNITFRNIQAEGESGIVLYGCEESLLRDLLLQDVRLRIRRGPLQESYGGNIDLRATSEMATSLFSRDIPGLLARHVERLRVQGFDLEWDEDLPAYFASGIECDQFRDVTIDSYQGRHAHPERPGAAILLSNGEEVTLRNCRTDDNVPLLEFGGDVQDLVVLDGAGNRRL